MKLDNNPGLRLSSPPRKSYNPFDSDDDSPRTVPAADTFVKNDDDFHLKDYETNPDPLAAAYVSNAADLSWEEAILGGHPKVDSDHAINADLDEKGGGLLEKENNLYTDKTVTDCELPEFVVCYDENPYQSVKDIGIDEGVPVPDNIWVKGCEDMDHPAFIDLKGSSSPTGSDDGKVDLQVDQGLQSKATEEAFTKESEKVNAPHAGGVDVHYSSHRFETDDAMTADVTEHNSADMKAFPDLSGKVVKTNKAASVVSGVADSNSTEAILELDSSVPRDSDLMHYHPNKQDVSDMMHGHQYKLDVSDLMHDHQNKLDISDLIHNHESSHDIADSTHDHQNFADSTHDHRNVHIHDVADLSHDHQNGQDVADLKHNHQTSHEVAEEKVGVTCASEDNIPSVQVLNPKHLIPPASTSDDGEIKVVPSQNQSEEAVALPLSPDLSTADESASSSNTEALTYDSKIETRSITSDFNSLNPLAPPGMAQEQKTVHAVEKAPQTQTMTRDRGEASFGAASVASFDGRVHGETSFSASALPSSITYSGPISYSGSVSLRSESSAGSTRSFAFPVLQTEWNSSPVRMAKADQRHFKKQKGWLESLLCCKF